MYELRFYGHITFSTSVCVMNGTVVAKQGGFLRGEIDGDKFEISEYPLLIKWLYDIISIGLV